MWGEVIKMWVVFSCKSLRHKSRMLLLFCRSTEELFLWHQAVKAFLDLLFLRTLCFFLRPNRASLKTFGAHCANWLVRGKVVIMRRSDSVLSNSPSILSEAEGSHANGPRLHRSICVQTWPHVCERWQVCGVCVCVCGVCVCVCLFMCTGFCGLRGHKFV